MNYLIFLINNSCAASHTWTTIVVRLNEKLTWGVHVRIKNYENDFPLFDTATFSERLVARFRSTSDGVPMLLCSEQVFGGGKCTPVRFLFPRFVFAWRSGTRFLWRFRRRHVGHSCMQPVAGRFWPLLSSATG